MKIATCAKVNLGLNIVSKRPDGYHNLETVFYPIPLSDEIEITPLSSEGCQLRISGNPIDGDPEKNLVVKAYKLLLSQYKLPGVSINLQKNVPMQAGMGGGSADCAYTLRLLNEMFALNIPPATLRQYAASLGADCAFFIDPQPSYAEGIGEKLEPVDIDLSSYQMVIVKPNVAVSTREAFANIHPHRPQKSCREVIAQPIETWREELTNDFEESIFPQYPEIRMIKEKLYEQGAVYAAMSGSGSAVFGIFEHADESMCEVFDKCFFKIV